MSSQFECKIKINGQTFDIAISDIKSDAALSFGYIFPKIAEICKIAANEVIEMERHSFDITNGTTQWRATRMDHIIKCYSIISITPKSFPNNFNVRTDFPVIPKVQKYVPNNDFRRQTFAKRKVNSNEVKSFKLIKAQKKLFKEEKSVQLFHKIVKAINIGWDLKGGANNPKWNAVSGLTLSKPLNAKNCCHNFYYWTHYYAQNYESIDGLLEPFYQNIFNLLKIVHTLDLDQLFSCSNKSAQKIKQISETKHFDRYFQNNLKEIWRQKLKNKEVVKKPNNIIPELTAKKINEENKSKDINNESLPQKRTVSHSAIESPKNCTLESRVPPNKPSFLSEYRKIKERVKIKKNKSFDSNNNNISIAQKDSISKSVPKTETTYELKDLIEEMKNDLKSVGEFDIISSNNSFHQKNTTYESVPKSGSTSINSLTQSSEKSFKYNHQSFEYNRVKECAKIRTPSTVMVVLPPKKTISLSDYRKKKENPSETVDKFDKNIESTHITVPSDPRLKRRLEMSQKEKPKESLLNIESNDEKETLKRQKPESTVPSDPRLKRRLEMLNNQKSNESS